VNKLRQRYNIVSNLEQIRRGKTPTNAYTTTQMTKLLDIHPS